MMACDRREVSRPVLPQNRMARFPLFFPGRAGSILLDHGPLNDAFHRFSLPAIMDSVRASPLASSCRQ